MLGLGCRLGLDTGSKEGGTVGSPSSLSIGLPVGRDEGVSTPPTPGKEAEVSEEGDRVTLTEVSNTDGLLDGWTVGWAEGSTVIDGTAEGSEDG